MTKVLIISHEPIVENMAGPPIRCLEIARALGPRFDVTLAVLNDVVLPGVPFKIAKYNWVGLKHLVKSFDVVVVAGFILPVYTFLKNIPGALVLDIYDPVLFELLEMHDTDPKLKQKKEFDRLVTCFGEQMRVGDFFICAGEPQRAMWLGMLLDQFRLNPVHYAQNRCFRDLIDFVPFGLPAAPPRKTAPAIKGVYPGIAATDFVVIWGGGIYNWLDPQTAVRAMAHVHRERPDIKLFFMGCKYPNPIVKMRAIPETMALSDSLGLTGKAVFFNDWVPYDRRADFLLEADIGLNLHPESVETDFSFRTRILDYIWTELPIITTRGGVLSTLVEEKQLGTIVDYEDDRGLAKAILDLAAGNPPAETIRANMRCHRDSLTWEKAVEPLARFCANPVRRIDRQFLVEKWTFTHPRYYLKRLRHLYTSGGLLSVFSRTALFFVRHIADTCETLRHNGEILCQKLQMPHVYPRFRRGRHLAMRFLRALMFVNLFIKHHVQVFGHKLHIPPPAQTAAHPVAQPSSSAPEKTYPIPISVIIPAYNGRDLLVTCLASLYQSDRKDFEVLVVDNGSTDGTEAFLAEHYPQVRRFIYKEGLGFARAANIGLREARGEYLVLLNQDTEVDPGWLSALKRRMDNDCSLGFGASKMLDYTYRDILDGAGDVYLSNGFAYRLGWSIPDSKKFRTSFSVFGACAGAAIYRKQMLDQIGLFDEDFNMYYEDVDLSFRARLAGFRCEFIHDAVVYHMGSAPKKGKFSEDNPKTLRLLARNSLYVVIKNFPLFMLLRSALRIAYARYLLCRGYFGEKREFGTAYLLGMLDVLLSLPSLFVKRWKLQRQSKLGWKAIRRAFQESERLMGIVHEDD